MVGIECPLTQSRKGNRKPICHAMGNLTTTETSERESRIGVRYSARLAFGPETGNNG